MKTLLLAAVAALAFGACRSDDARSAPASALHDLSASLDVLRTEFNAHVGEARFLTLLAPT
jgi:hypothetical protein